MLFQHLPKKRLMIGRISSEFLEEVNRLIRGHQRAQIAQNVDISLSTPFHVIQLEK